MDLDLHASDFLGKTQFEKEHIQIPPTSYVGLILRSTAVATASPSAVEGTTRVL